MLIAKWWSDQGYETMGLQIQNRDLLEGENFAQRTNKQFLYVEERNRLKWFQCHTNASKLFHLHHLQSGAYTSCLFPCFHLFVQFSTTKRWQLLTNSSLKASIPWMGNGSDLLLTSTSPFTQPSSSKVVSSPSSIRQWPLGWYFTNSTASSRYSQATFHPRLSFSCKRSTAACLHL